MRKKFDEKLYNNNDPAKYLAIEFFRTKDKIAVVNPDDYGIDLIVDGKFYCEVEVKHSWKGENFTFSTLQIPERKNKFTVSDKPVMFMIFNSDKSYAFLVKGEDVLDSPLVEVSNKYVKSGEKFFQIPVSKLTKVRLGV